MNLYKKTKQFVTDSFAKAGKPADISHGERTAFWIKHLKPDADEALLVAGIAHDIERAFYGDWKKGSSNPDSLRKHQDLSSAEIEKFLRSENAPKDFIERVKHLVARHEEGGDEDQNILCDADCLAFFEEKALRRVRKWKEHGKSKKEIKEHLNYYFSRITSEKTRQIARKWYDEALQEIKT